MRYTIVVAPRRRTRRRSFTSPLFRVHLREYFRDSAGTRSSSTTIFPSTRRPTVRSHCAAPAAGAKRIRRRVLSAFASAGARGEMKTRPRGVADALPSSRRRRAIVGVHSDERHFDHRRPDLPGIRSVQPGRPPAINVGNSVSRVGGNAQVKRCARWPARCGSTWRSTASCGVCAVRQRSR